MSVKKPVVMVFVKKCSRGYKGEIEFPDCTTTQTDLYGSMDSLCNAVSAKYPAYTLRFSGSL